MNVDPTATYPLFMGYLPPPFAEKLEKEWHETRQVREHKIQQVRKLLRDENDISEEWFPNDFILAHLRTRKHHVDEAFIAIKKMVAFVKKNQSLYQTLDPLSRDRCIEMAYPIVSPKRNKDGCVVGIGKLSRWDPSVVEHDDLAKYMIQIGLNLIADPMTQVNGVILLYDFKDSFQLKYAPFVTPSKLKLYYHLLECMAGRLKAAHILNPNIFTKAVLAVILPMMPEKLKKRIYVHNDGKDVAKHVQANVIPMEYGGTLLPNEMRNDWAKNLSMPDYIKSILKSG